MFYLTTHSTHFIYGYIASGHGRPQVGATGGGGSFEKITWKIQN